MPPRRLSNECAFHSAGQVAQQNGLVARSTPDAESPREFEIAFRANRRRVRSDKGRRLNRWRSEKCERSFAHVCETGGGRRMWLRGLENASKSHLLRCAGYNLGLVLRKCYGMSKPRSAAVAAVMFFILGLFLTLGITGPDSHFSPAKWTLGGPAIFLLCAWAAGLFHLRIAKTRAL